MNKPSKLAKARFILSVSAIYALALLFLMSSFEIGVFKDRPIYANSLPTKPALPVGAVVNMGKPVQITVPRLGINLPVLDGTYNPADQSWTLSGYNAHFALPSMPANDLLGVTLIYGHNNNDVFGGLKNLKPGDHMQLVAGNGLVFNYTYSGYSEHAPEDVTIFNYSGKPKVVVQTCSGNWNEIRRMYEFSFTGLTKPSKQAN